MGHSEGHSERGAAGEHAPHASTTRTPREEGQQGEFPDVLYVPYNFLHYHWVGECPGPAAGSSPGEPRDFYARASKAANIVPIPELDAHGLRQLLSASPAEREARLSSQENAWWENLDAHEDGKKAGRTPPVAALISEDSLHMVLAGVLKPSRPRGTDRADIHPVAIVFASLETQHLPQALLFAPLGCQLRRYAKSLRELAEAVGTIVSMYLEPLYLSDRPANTFNRSIVISNIRRISNIRSFLTKNATPQDVDPLSDPRYRYGTKGRPPAPSRPQKSGKEVFSVVAEISPGYGIEGMAFHILNEAFCGLFSELDLGHKEPSRFLPIYTWRSKDLGELDTLVRQPLAQDSELDWHWCSSFPLLPLNGLRGAYDINTNILSRQMRDGRPDKPSRGSDPDSDYPPWASGEPSSTSSETSSPSDDIPGEARAHHRNERPHGSPRSPFPTPQNVRIVARIYHLMHPRDGYMSQPNMLVRDSSFGISDFRFRCNVFRNSARVCETSGAGDDYNDYTDNSEDHDIIADSLSRCVAVLAPGFEFRPSYWIPVEGSIIIRFIPYLQPVPGMGADLFSQNAYLTAGRCNGIVYFLVRVPVAPTADEVAEVVRLVRPLHLEIGESLGTSLLPAGETQERVRLRLTRLCRVQSESTPFVVPPSSWRPDPSPTRLELVVDLSGSAGSPVKARTPAPDNRPGVGPAPQQNREPPSKRTVGDPGNSKEASSPAPTVNAMRPQTPAVYPVPREDFEAMLRILGLQER